MRYSTLLGPSIQAGMMQTCRFFDYPMGHLNNCSAKMQVYTKRFWNGSNGAYVVGLPTFLKKTFFYGFKGFKWQMS